MQLFSQIDTKIPTLPYLSNTETVINSTKEEQLNFTAFHIFNENKSYVSITGCLFDHITTTKDLSNIEKIYYLLINSLAFINSKNNQQRSTSLSSKVWAKLVGCSRSQVFTLQQSLEKKGYLIITKNKNIYKQNKRNLLTPTLPDILFKSLRHTPDRVGVKCLDYVSSCESKIEYLDRTKLFIPVNYHLLKIITSNSDLSSLQKVIWLDFYAKCHKYHISSNKTLGFSFITSYEELMERYGCSKAVLSKIMNILENNNFITKKRFLCKKDIALEDRQDKSLWHITLALPASYSLELINIKDRANLAIEQNSSKEINSNIKNILPTHTQKHQNSISAKQQLCSYPTVDYSDKQTDNDSLDNKTPCLDTTILTETIALVEDSPINTVSQTASEIMVDKTQEICALQDNVSCTDPHVIKSRPHINKYSKLNFKDLDNIDKRGNFLISDNFKNLSELSVSSKNSLEEEKKEVVAIKPEEVSSNNSLQNKPITQSDTSCKNKPMKEEGKEIKNISVQLTKSSSNNSYVISGKTLKSFYPLTKEQVDRLNSLSGRSFFGEFSVNFANQLLLKLYCRDSSKLFLSKNHMMSYMSKAFSYEKHQAPLVNHESFRFTVNVSDAESVEQRKIEKYLSEVECSIDTSCNSQLRRKIAGIFESKLAYKILIESQFDYEPGNNQDKEESIIIKLPEDIELTYLQERILEKAVMAVYGNIAIVYEKTAIEKWNKKNISIEEGIKLEELDKSSTWYKVRRELKKQLGEFVDKVWFSKLRVEENIEKKILTLYAPSNFIRDWINNKYGYVVRQLSKELGYQEVITTLNNQ